MSGHDNSEPRTVRLHLLLAAVGGAAAGASRAVVSWLLGQIGWT